MCIGGIQIILCSFYPIFQVLDVYRGHSDHSLLILSYFSGVDVRWEHSDHSLLTCRSRVQKSDTLRFPRWRSCYHTKECHESGRSNAGRPQTILLCKPGRVEHVYVFFLNCQINNFNCFMSFQLFKTPKFRKFSANPSRYYTSVVLFKS